MRLIAAMPDELRERVEEWPEQCEEYRAIVNGFRTRPTRSEPNRHVVRCASWFTTRSESPNVYAAAYRVQRLTHQERRRRPIKPIRPEPKRTSVEGSGTTNRHTSYHGHGGGGPGIPGLCELEISQTD